MGCTGDGQFDPIAVEPACRVEIGAGYVALAAADRDRRAEIGSPQHLLALRNDAEQRYRQDFAHVIDAEHLTTRNPRRIEPGDQEMLVQAPPSLDFQRP